MQYGKPAGTAGGILAGNAALAATGVRAWFWAEVAVVLIVLGLVLVRIATVRRQP